MYQCKESRQKDLPILFRDRVSAELSTTADNTSIGNGLPGALCVDSSAVRRQLLREI